MDGRKKFEETSLPPKNAFYNRLNMKGISDQDHEHAQQVWNTMDKKTLGCYHDTYFKTDVLLLADILEAFVQVASRKFLHRTWIGVADLIKDSRRVLQT